MIDGIFLISNSELKKFYDDLSEKIKVLQDDGQEVEIQYSTDKVQESDGRNVMIISICHSALVLGRKNKSQGDVEK